jgi:hypothetical protein
MRERRATANYRANAADELSILMAQADGRAANTAQSGGSERGIASLVEGRAAI